MGIRRRFSVGSGRKKGKSVTISRRAHDRVLVDASSGRERTHGARRECRAAALTRGWRVRARCGRGCVNPEGAARAQRCCVHRRWELPATTGHLRQAKANRRGAASARPCSQSVAYLLTRELRPAGRAGRCSQSGERAVRASHARVHSARRHRPTAVHAFPRASHVVPRTQHSRDAARVGHVACAGVRRCDAAGIVKGGTRLVNTAAASRRIPARHPARSVDSTHSIYGVCSALRAACELRSARRAQQTCNAKSRTPHGNFDPARSSPYASTARHKHVCRRPSHVPQQHCARSHARAVDAMQL